MNQPALAPRCRRGSTMVIGVLGLIAALCTVGLGIDTGRLVITRHKDQTIADAATMAAMVQLPYRTRALAAANKVLDAYRVSYRRSFTPTITFIPDTDVPTSVRVSISDTTPSIFPGLMGVGSRGSQGSGMGSRMIPAALLTGAVPLGFQYDDSVLSFEYDGNASPSQVTLKLGKGDKKVVSGNCYPLDLNGSGASDWGSWLKHGYTSKLAVGDDIDTETGTMTGPTEQALVTDIDSRLNRGDDGIYADDTYTSFSPGNPRIVCLPLVDWKSASGGKSTLAIKGFAAFWIDEYENNSAKIKGRFVRYTVPKGSAAGTTWDGISIDPTTSSNYDGGLWTATLVE